MEYKCDGETYCEKDKEATVTVFFDNKKQSTKFTTKETPICVEEERINIENGKRIFHFYSFNYDSEGNATPSFEHYACGREAYYQPHPDLEHVNGAHLIVDGKIQHGNGYYYWDYMDENGGTRRFLEVVDEIPEGIDGDFSECQINGCEISIKNSSKNEIFKGEGKSPCRVEVACGDECPPGYLKCSSNKYPGYCCLPCKETSKKIQSLGNKL